MKGAIIYFSGTGNTKYVAELFKSKFESSGDECLLFDIEKNEELPSNLDFYVFGGPIYAGLFPQKFVEWIKEKVQILDSKNCIVFSTQGSNSGQGVNQLQKVLEPKGFIVQVKELIEMPNNYYLPKFFNETPKEKAKNLIAEVDTIVSAIVKNFKDGMFKGDNKNKLSLKIAELEYKMFNKRAQTSAKRNYSADKAICNACGKCMRECPSKNITMDKTPIFGDSCMACHRCIHKCPLNAIMYKGKHINQYKLEI